MKSERSFFENEVPIGEIPNALTELLKDSLNSAKKNIVIVWKFSDGTVRVMTPLGIEESIKLLKQGIELRQLGKEKKKNDDEKDDGDLGFGTILLPKED